MQAKLECKFCFTKLIQPSNSSDAQQVVCPVCQRKNDINPEITKEKQDRKLERDQIPEFLSKKKKKDLKRTHQKSNTTELPEFIVKKKKRSKDLNAGLEIKSNSLMTLADRKKSDDNKNRLKMLLSNAKTEEKKESKLQGFLKLL